MTGVGSRLRIHTANGSRDRSARALTPVVSTDMTEGEAVIKSIVVGGRLLKVLSEADQPVALKYLATRAQMYPSKAHRYLASFVEIGLVSQDDKTRHYSLGPLAIQLGFSALKAHRPLQFAVGIQAELREQFNETFALSVWSTQGPIVVHVDESSHAVAMTMRIGAVLPPLTTATGLVFAAHLPPHRTHRVIADAVGDAGPPTASTHWPNDLTSTLNRVRQAGYAFNSGHLTPGASALAVPIFDHVGTVTAVTAAVGQKPDIDPAQRPELLAAMQVRARHPARTKIRRRSPTPPTR